jgi:hypothetical protein
MTTDITKLDFESSAVYEKSAEAVTRLVVNQGGTSSGKTWSILQLLIVKHLIRIQFV